MEDELERGPMFIGVNTARAAESQIRWARAAMFLTLHSGALLVGLPILFRAEGLSLFLRATLICIASVGGDLLAVLWLLLNRRANSWLEAWNKKLMDLENIKPVPVVRIYSSIEIEHEHLARPSFHGMLNALCWLMILLWSIICLGSFCTAVMVSIPR